MNGLTVYRSSAGSGKTFILVKTYLTLLFNARLVTGFKQILAITFTNKAAEEMKKRVLSALEMINNEGNVNLLAKEIALEINCNVDDIVNKSSKIYNKILHNYSDFSIMTIDKFTNQIIRAFSKELNLSDTYEIILEEYEFFENVISEFIDQTENNEYNFKLIKQFIDESVRQGVQSNIENLLKKFNKIIFQTDFIKNKQQSRDNLKNLRDYFLKNLRQNESEINTHCLNGISILKNSNVESKWQLYSRVDKVLNSYSNYKTLSYDEVIKWSEWGENDKWFKKSLNVDQLQQINNVKKDLLIELNHIIAKLLEWIKLLELYRLVTPFSLVHSLLTSLDNKKSQQNVILISDFNFLVSDIIKNEPAGYVFEKIGNRYKYILIDEFQDTSKMQWENIIPLIHESLSNGGENLIVGDSKQAIYRWRNGNAEQFVNLPSIPDNKQFSSYQSLITQSFNSKVLNNNWRSAINIIKFNNWLFENVSKEINHREVIAAYADVKQNIKKTNVGSIHFLVKEKGELNLKIYISNKIKKLSTKGFSYSDIVFLVRSKKDGNKIIEVLEDLNIPFKSEDSVFLGYSNSFKLLYYALRYFEFKFTDDLKLLGHFLEIYFKNSPDLLLKVNNNLKNLNFSFYKNLFDFQKLNFVIDTLNLNSKDPYIDVFLNTALEKINKNNFTVGELLNFLKDNAIKILVESISLNAIQIMTIHKSKGLEFPVVIIPFGSWVNKSNLNPSFIGIEDISLKNLKIDNYIGELSKKSLLSLGKFNIYDQEQSSLILDNLNLYYVAFTRPVEELHVVMNDSKNVNNVCDVIVSKIKNHDLYNPKNGEILIEENSIHTPIKKQQAIDPVYTLNKGTSQYKFNNTQDFLIFSKKPTVGEIFHESMSRVENDFSKAYKYLEHLHNNRLCSEIIIEKCKFFINKIEKSNSFDFIFKNYDFVYNEREIFDENGGLLRIDRLVIKNSEAIVIDYKTTKEKLNAHIDQIKNYINVLNHTAFEKVSGYLLYVDSLELVKIT
tara:strand:- start:2724 stop:5747 length:3024 start_codon:yes stop_codon:yes gene_type:complete